MKKLKVAVLGATGVVGQQFIRMLESHPSFDVAALTASEKSAGKRYGERVRWVVSGDIPEFVADIPIVDIDASSLERRDIRVAFSALPTEIAQETESRYVEEGIAVFSNASAYRMKKNVPILIPEVNPEHLTLVDIQKERSPGFIVTNSNCTASGLALALKPLIPFNIAYVTITTYQALSGAGLPGIPSLEALGNIIPFIESEEEKVETETKKILGTMEEGGISNAGFEVNASCARVPVRDGHLESVVVEFENETEILDIEKAFIHFSGMPQQLKLPTAPQNPIIVRKEENRPQPQLDLMAGYPSRAAGMAVSVGRIRKKGNKISFFLLVHNTIRGAAGASILNAEFAYEKKYVR
jgi:aspartate-semialdehyde dehydrogenase